MIRKRMTICAVIPKGSNWDEMMRSNVRCVGGSSFSSESLETLADTVLFCNVHGIPKIRGSACGMSAGDRARCSAGTAVRKISLVETHLVRLKPPFSSTQRKFSMCWMTSEMVSVDR